MSNSPVFDFTSSLFGALLRMDAEAVPSPDGSPTGLNYYGKHRHPDQIKPQTEPSWTQRFAELLGNACSEAKKEHPYPELAGCSTANRCDNVIVFPDQTILWLENKGAWKEYWRRKGQPGKFRSHLFESSNSAFHDIQKIAPLCLPHANYVGFLLLGFDSLDSPMMDEIDEFALSSGLSASPWFAASMHWPDRWRQGERVHAWFWWRQATVSVPQIDT